MEKIDILQNLNPEQKKAVIHQKGPLLIVAGAGTGKTTVITCRIAYLMMEKNIKSDEILGLTFTNKASEEMQERIDKLLPYGYVDLWISTFHSFAQRILEEHAIDIGLSSDVELLDDTRAWLFVREHFEKFDLDYYRPSNNPTKFIKDMLRHFSRLKDEEISPQQYLEYAESIKSYGDDMEGSGGKSKKRYTELGEGPSESHANGQSRDFLEYLSLVHPGPQNDGKRITEIANAYHVYQQLLLDHNKMDFGDLINYCLTLFKKRPNILKKYQKQFKYILVDEFQDTNWAQYDLVKMLASPQNNISVVADDDQSIYRFRGASMSNVLQFSKEFPKSEKVSLVKNYRSGQEILDLSHGFIEQNNPNRLEASTELKLSKKLESKTNQKSSVIHLHSKTVNDEARIISETMLEIKSKDKDSSWNDFAILVRANAQAQAFEEALQSSHIPHQNYSASGLYKTPIVANIISFMQLLNDFNESRALYRMINLPFVNIDTEDVIKMTHYASKKRISLFEIIKYPQKVGITRELSITEISKILFWVQTFGEKSKTQKPSIILLSWLREGGYLDYLNNLKEAESLEQYRLLRFFWNHLKQLELGISDARVKDIIEILQLELDSGDTGSLPVDLDEGPELARIMTVHSAKGLEFKYVFVANMVDKRFPSIGRKDAIQVPDELVKEIVPKGDHHIEEERRLFYVAMTRAKVGLFFTSAENYGGSTTKKLSRFLVELEHTSKDVFKTSTQVLSGEKDSFLPRSTNKVKPEEKLLIPKFYSYTQLKAFVNCPFAYKLQYIYKVPMPGSGALSYGISMHSTMQHFFQLLMQKTEFNKANLFGSANTLSNSGSDIIPVSYKELLEIYEKVWIGDWYKSEEDKKTKFKHGKKVLQAFYNDLGKSDLPNVKALERGFKIRINEYTVIGKIDRVDILPDGYVEIIDYKTGKPPKTLSPEDRDQLLIYKIATEEVFGEKVKQHTYYYLDHQEKISFEGSDTEVDKLKQKIIDIIEQIKVSDFQPNSKHRFCDYCDYFGDSAFDSSK